MQRQNLQRFKAQGQLTPLHVGAAVGVPAGLVLGVLSLISGVIQSGGAVIGLLDAVFAFIFGAILVGGIAAFVAWRREVGSLGDVAPPGWYESPEDEKLQWFWTGSRWTERTRPTPPRTTTRRF